MKSLKLRKLYLFLKFPLLYLQTEILKKNGINERSHIKKSRRYILKTWF